VNIPGALTAQGRTEENLAGVRAVEGINDVDERADAALARLAI